MPYAVCCGTLRYAMPSFSLACVCVEAAKGYLATLEYQISVVRTHTCMEEILYRMRACCGVYYIGICCAHARIYVG